MIIGTAGHIDHGKTTLVRALTGVDTDRLPEEKKRGISIELGYAFMDLPGQPGQRIGFIDVPGHERLVHTMIAGASGIDFALLLVAADDGPMPQTLEHLAVLSLLGIARGAVVITKADRADAARIASVQAQMAALLAPTPLAGAPMLAVSAHTGQGIEALRTLILQAARQQAAPGHSPWAASGPAPALRLAIDRAFTLQGTGTVVTGTIHAGQVRVGDELAITPAARPLRARVRSLHAQNQPVDMAHAGQRCAVALAGIAKDDITRGQWLCAPAVALHTQRLDARLHLWPGETRPLRSGAHVLAHIGAAQAAATLAVLDADTLPPGGTALVQLLLQTPLAAWHGERLLLRDAAASRTLAGGVALDPFAPARYRRSPQRLAELAALCQGLPGQPASPPAESGTSNASDASHAGPSSHTGSTPNCTPPPQPAAAPATATPAARLQALLAASPHGLDIARLAAAQGWHSPPFNALPPGALAQGSYALGAAQAAAIETAALQTLQAFHARQPDELGPDSARLRRLCAPRLPAPLWQALLARLAATGRVRLQGPVAHLPTHGAELSANETRIAQKTAPALAAAGFEGAWARELAKHAGEGEPLVRTTLARLARRGELHQIVKDLFYAPASMQRLADIARQVATTHGGDIQAAHFRDATGLGRKRAIQVLEYFDRIGLTRRVGDTHRLRPDATLFTSPPG